MVEEKNEDETQEEEPVEPEPMGDGAGADLTQKRAPTGPTRAHNARSARAREAGTTRRYTPSDVRAEYSPVQPFADGTVVPPLPPETQRLDAVLHDLYIGKGGGPVKDSIMKEWMSMPPQMHNPQYLYNACVARGIPPDRATYIVSVVFRPENAALPQFAQGGYYGYAPGFAQPQGAPQQAVGAQDAAQTVVDEMMGTLMDAMKIRAFSQALAPALGNAGGAGSELMPQVETDAEGHYVRDQFGNPKITLVAMSPKAGPLAAMMNQYQQGKQIDPMELSTAMMGAFTKGMEIAGQNRPAGPSYDQIAALQQQNQQLAIENLRQQYAMTEKIFEQERSNFQERLEQMSPEAQKKQFEALKGLGLFGTDNLEALKLQMRYDAWKADRSDQKELEMTKAKAQYEEQERSRSQLRELVELGKSAITDAIKPLTSAVGDGLRQRVAAGGPVGPAPGVNNAQPGVTPKSFEQMTPQEREAYKARLTEIRRTLEQREQQIAQAESQGTSSEPGGTGYGEAPGG